MPFWKKVYGGDKEKEPRTAQEHIANDLKIPEPLVILDKSRARITPPENVKAVTPPEYTIVFFKPSQKRRSSRMYL